MITLAVYKVATICSYYIYSFAKTV